MFFCGACRQEIELQEGIARNPLHFYNVLLLVAIVMCMAIDTSICERGFSLMNLLKTAKRSRMGNELVPIAHADGRVQPGQRRGLERPYIPKSPWMPSLSCGVSSRATDGIQNSSSQASSRCWKPAGTV